MVLSSCVMMLLFCSIFVMSKKNMVLLWLIRWLLVPLLHLFFRKIWITLVMTSCSVLLFPSIYSLLLRFRCSLNLSSLWLTMSCLSLLLLVPLMLLVILFRLPILLTLIDMSILAATAGLLGNVVGGLVNQSSQRSINQMNNEFNSIEAQKSRDFQLDMWNRQNEYNTPSQQRARLEAAGLNPYMMLNGGNAGVASNPGSAAATAGSPGSPPFSSEMGSSFVSQLLTSRMTDANVAAAESQSSLNKSLADKAVGDTNWSNYSPEVRKWLMSNSLNRQINVYTREQNDTQNAAYQGFLMQAQAAKTLLDGEAQSILNRYLPESQQSQLGLTAAQIVSLQKSGQLSDARALESLASRMKSLAEAEGKRIDNRIARRTAESLIRSVNASNQASAKYAGPSAATNYLLGRASYRSAKAKASLDEFLESRKSTSYWLDKGSVVGNLLGNGLPSSKAFKIK